jgi:hypothetical protein
MQDPEWFVVRTLLSSRAHFAAEAAAGFANLNDEQKRALRKGLLSRGRGTDANRVRHAITTP